MGYLEGVMLALGFASPKAITKDVRWNNPEFVKLMAGISWDTIRLGKRLHIQGGESASAFNINDWRDFIENAKCQLADFDNRNPSDKNLQQGKVGAKVQCKNCGQLTSFGERADYKRVDLGWCIDCFKASELKFTHRETGEQRWIDQPLTIDGVKSRWTPK